MIDSTLPFSPMRLRLIVVGFTLAMLLAGCSKHDDTGTVSALPRVDACTLVTTAMVQRLAPGLGAGYLVKPRTRQPGNITTCAWDDAHHIPALTLTVAPADPSGVAGGLEDGFANMGYRIMPVTGLGDEAATAVQKANPKYELTVAVAILSVRVGRRQLVFSPVMLTISGPGTLAFTHLKQFAAKAITRFGTRKQ